MYLLVWVFLIGAASAWMRSASVSFSVLLAAWVVLCIVAPRIAASSAQAVAPVDSKIETDFAVLASLREERRQTYSIFLPESTTSQPIRLY